MNAGHPHLVPAPATVQTVSGTERRPPLMKAILAAWLKSWSDAKVMKSLNIRSTSGRRPPSARPTATPMTAPSLIGVFRTLSGPNTLDEALGQPERPTGSHVLAEHEHIVIRGQTGI